MARLWVVRAGRRGERESDAIDKNKILLGFETVKDISQCSSREEVSEKLREALPDLKPRAHGGYATQLFQFSYEIQKNDYVMMPRKGTNKVAIGIVTDKYKYDGDDPYKHSRAVKWKDEAVLRDVFKQDIRSSLNGVKTVYEIKKYNALERVKNIIKSGIDPGDSLGNLGSIPDSTNNDNIDVETDEPRVDIEDAANQQIISLIREEFMGHALADLVAEIMRAKGYTTRVSPPGPDGGVDILAVDGKFGLGKDSICVQVKSGDGTADSHVVRLLRDSVSTSKARAGLLVSIGGVNKGARSELKKDFFKIRLWEMPDLLEKLFETYEKLSDETRSKLPLKQIWVPVSEDDS